MKVRYFLVFLFIAALYILPNSTHAATVTFATVDTDADPILVQGTTTESGGTISAVEHQVDSTAGVWVACTAGDGIFDEASEAFTCTLASLADGSHIIYIKTTSNTPVPFQATTTDLTSSLDYARGVTVDANNVYVTGRCSGCGALGGGAFYTIAYDKSDNSFVWATSTDPTSSHEDAYDITSDANNVYVTGSCSGCGALGGLAFHTIAYDKTDASFVWATTTDPTIGLDDAFDIAVDTSNVYVVGRCTGCGALGDAAFYTIAYDKTDASFVWATTTDVSSNSDYARGVTADSTNVYVTGPCIFCGPDSDLGAYFTIAYSALDGSFVWSTTTDPTPGDFDEAIDIISDSNNVYTTGYCGDCGSLDAQAYHTIAFDKSDGSFVWATTTDRTSSYDYAESVAVDTNNVYVTGYCTSCGSLGSDAFHTIAYDKTDTSFVWSTITDVTSDADFAHAVTADSEYVYVTGVCTGCGSVGGAAYHTIAYNPLDGSVLEQGTSTASSTFTIVPAPSEGGGGSTVSYGSKKRKETIELVSIEVGTPTVEVLTKQLHQLQASLAAILAQQNTKYYEFHTDLEPGSTHPDVTELQQSLEEQGHLKMPPGVAYGYYGPLTQAAVTEFQVTQDITPPTGYFGQETRTALTAYLARYGTKRYEFLVDLFLGSTIHPDVTELQQYLERQGYLTMPAGVSYGYFGPLTEAAVARLQADHSITPAVGYLGPKTRALINPQ